MIVILLNYDSHKARLFSDVRSCIPVSACDFSEFELVFNDKSNFVFDVSDYDLLFFGSLIDCLNWLSASDAETWSFYED